MTQAALPSAAARPQVRLVPPTVCRRAWRLQDVAASRLVQEHSPENQEQAPIYR